MNPHFRAALLNSRLLLLLLICVVVLSFEAIASAIVFDTNTIISIINTNYDGQDIVVSNCVLTVDGARSFASVRVTGGGTLTHSAPANGQITITATVSQEPQVLTGTNAATLAQTNIQTGTVVVTDQSGLLTYTNNADYILENVGAALMLRRTDSSTIPDGATVLVTYNYIVASGTSGLDLAVSGDVTVDAGSAISVNGSGYASFGMGSGASLGSPASGGGGGHGGEGGTSSSGAPGGISYDSVSQPTDKGGAGGNGSNGSGGRGGGEIKLTVTGTLAINGAIRANGFDGTTSRSGGGAGGSIWLSAGTMSGAGTISASGGAGEPVHGGGGGGGRIAVYFNTNLYVGGIAARGGAGNIAGGAGTIYSRTNSSSQGFVIVENGGVVGRKTSLSGVPSTANLRITDGAAAYYGGSLSLNSLLIGSNAMMLAQSNTTLTMTVSGNATIQPGGVLSAVSAGSSPGAGTGAGGTYVLALVTSSGGGGGHGGTGGMGTNTTANGGVSYGSIASPSTAGSGGGGRTNNFPIGGVGGGIIRATINGRFAVDGAVTVSGTPGVFPGGGGGSGGSLWLTAGILSGNGSLTANGGNGILPNGGGGGGGRIAIETSSNQFSGIITAFGGSGTNNRGAGTINLYGNVTDPVLIVDNGGLPGALTPVTTSSGVTGGYPTDFFLRGGATATWTSGQGFRNFFIGSNSWLTVSGTSYPAFTVYSNVVIQATGGILSDGMASSGSGVSGSGTGGSYGGFGGLASNATFIGLTYGSVNSITLAGSQGGTSGSATAGLGGGLIRFSFPAGIPAGVGTGVFQNDGLISANGSAGTVTGTGTGMAGGGSGGGISITAPMVSGSGIIRANGGNGINNGGGGGGGRIFLGATSNLFSGQVTAIGGTGFRNGGAGTVYIQSSNNKTVIIDNGGLNMISSNTPLSLANAESVQIRSSGRVVMPFSSQTWTSLLVGSNSSLIFPLDSGMLTITSNATVEAGGSMSADGSGSNPGSGSGGGGSGGTGGGHGGNGGSGSNSTSGGASYGSISSPQTAGSGGGVGSTSTAGRGGGLLRFTVSRALRMDGSLTANGTDASSLAGTSPTAAGGGSGGGILLTVGTLSGNGQIRANGGSGTMGGGGGGGGRIAVFYQTNNFSGSVATYGGSGFRNGGAGTIYIKQTGANIGAALIDNGGLSGTNTPITSFFSADDCVVQGGAVVSSSGILAVRNMQVKSNSWLVLNSSSAGLNAGIDITIDAGGGALADGWGNSGVGSFGKPGGSHGGYGGSGSGVSGPASGSIVAPNLAGSGGGGLSPTHGGKGGGVAQLTAGRTLTVNGVLSANGLSGEVFEGGGGGAGGSINIGAGTITGNGIIRADGGTGTGTGGGGGGGRIAMRADTNIFAGTVSAAGGAGSVGGGAGTIYRAQTLFTLNPKAISVTVDNNGVAGTNTPLSSANALPTTPFSLQIQNGGVAVPTTALPLLSNLFVNAAGTLQLSSSQTSVAVLNNAIIAAGGSLSATRKGFAHSSGTGQGTNAASQGSGGGYGGKGGASLSGATAGIKYGSATQPIDFGSGGGNGAGTYLGGAEGGGAIRLFVGNKLTVDGRVESDGGAGLQDDAGGGSGGSVWITAGALEGAGLLTARGGDGDLFGGGGGGGGRIALYCPNTNSSSVMVLTNGGNGATPGEAGTYFYASAIPSMQVVSQSPTGTVSNAVSSVDFVFISPPDPASLSAADVVIQPPSGPALTNVTVSTVNLTTLRASFPAQTTNGQYAITVGPNINDVFGQPMQAAYNNSFTIALPVIQGTVTNLAGQPVAGVTMTPTGGLPPVVTDANGNYSLSFVPGDFTVTPTLENFTVLPTSRSYTNLLSSITGENFLAVDTIAPTLSSSLAGTNLNLSWYGLPGVTYQLYASTNLVDWLPSGVPLAGSNTVVQLPVPMSDAPQLFIKVGAGN